MTHQSDPHYVYGITEPDELVLDIAAINGSEEVTTMQHRELGVLVSRVSSTEIDRTDENLKAHDRVLREALTHGDGRTVVPMRYGMVFSNQTTLKTVLDGAYRSLRNSLDELAETVELGIKVVGGTNGSPDRDEIERAAANTVDPISLAAVDNELFSDRLLLNRSYLVRRDDQDQFGEAVANFEEQASAETTVQYTGPWAPYNFVDIEIGAQR